MDAELKEHLEGMEGRMMARIDGVRSDLIERIEITEMRLLTEFWK